MSSLQPAMTIVMAEVSIILTALIGYLTFRYLRNNRDIMSAIQKLANKIRLNKDDRHVMLHDFLVQTCCYDEETANTAATALIEKERLFYTSLMETYLTRDHDALHNMDSKTEEVIGAYRDLLTVSVKAISADAELDIETRTKQLSKTIDDLSERNKTLSGEVEQLKREMDVTVEEYSSAFRNQQINDELKDADDSESTDTATDADTNIDVETEIETTQNEDHNISEQASDDTAAISSDDNVEPNSLDDSVEPDFETNGFNETSRDEPDTSTSPDAIDVTADITVADSEPSAENDEPENTEPGPLPEDSNTTDPAALDDEISADLEALAAQLDVEEEGLDTNPGISMDGLDDDNSSSASQA